MPKPDRADGAARDRRALVHYLLATLVVLSATGGVGALVLVHRHAASPGRALSMSPTAADAPAVPSRRASSTSPPTARPSPPPSAQPSPRPSPPSPSGTPADSALAEALHALGGDISVGVTDTATGRSGTYAPGDIDIDTASIVKVAILATLLLDAQDHGRTLTGTERALATTMIENSDDPAATTLWHEVGGAWGMARGFSRLGMTRSVPGVNGFWGVTTTTAADQLRLLSDLTVATSPLSSASRAYILSLMRQVEPAQVWGVSAAADSGTTPALKVGWFEHTDTGTWVVNSVGVISHDGHQALVAVLTDHQASLAAGEALADRVAEAAVRAVCDD